MINTTQTSRFITRDNVKYAHTKGVSQNCRSARFIPAFRDSVTGEVCLSRFEDGSTAPVHMLDGMPDHWVIERDEDNHVVRIKGSIIAGFVRDGNYYSREEIEGISKRRTGVRSQPAQVSKLPQLRLARYVNKREYPMRTAILVLLLSTFLLPVSALAQEACSTGYDQQPCIDAFFPGDSDALTACQACYSDALNLCVETKGKILNFRQCNPIRKFSVLLGAPGISTCAKAQRECKQSCLKTLGGAALVPGSGNTGSVGASVACRAGCSDPTVVEKCAEVGIYNPVGSRDICQSQIEKAKATRDAVCNASGSPVAVAFCRKISEVTFIKETAECSSGFAPVLVQK